MSPTIPPKPTVAGKAARGAGRKLWQDFNTANASAGATAVLWYAFGAIPVFLGVVDALRLPADVATSWFAIIFLTSVVSSLPLTLYYRQPLAIGWTIPGLVLIGAVGTNYRFEEIVGANLVCGLLIVVVGVTGMADRLMRWLPLPIVLGMFAGSVLSYATMVFSNLGLEPVAVGLALLGFVGAKAIDRPWLPPVAGAVLLGIAGAALAGRAHPEAFAWAVPSLTLFRPDWNPGSFLTISLPLAILAIAAGSVQGFGLLIAQGYAPPIKLATSLIGINTIVNAFFGGHASTLQRAGTAIVAGEEAGPIETRYVANLIASVGALLLAATAATAGTLLGVLPGTLIAALAGLAILTTLLDAIRRSTASDLPLGAFFALAIAASPLTILGIGSTFWALVGGLLVSFLAERRALQAQLRGT